jgi:protein O-mannosyl-transferase
MARHHQRPPENPRRRRAHAPATPGRTAKASYGDRPVSAIPPAPLPPGAPSAGNWRMVAFGAALVVLTLAAYSGVRHLQFVPLDDQGYVYENPHVRAGLTMDGFHWALTAGEQANWHPLTWLSHMLDVQLFGLDAGRHHLTSLAFHTINTLLLFVLLARSTGAVGRSACVAALFAVHPLHVESVAWIAERKDVLSTFFWLLTMGAHVWYARAPGRWRYAAVVAGLALGLMSKPMLVTLPFVLLLFDVWPLGRVSLVGVPADRAHADARTVRLQTALRLVREKLPLFAFAAAAGVVTVLVQARGGAVGSLDVLPFGVRVANALTSYVQYLLKAIWPARLAAFYPHARSIPLWQSVGALAILAAITWMAFRAARRRPALFVGWCWYLVTLAPVIGLIQVGTQSMADRYTYVPLIGVFVIVVWGAADGLARLPGRRLVLAAAAGAVIVASAAATRAQVEHWHDGWALWTHALTVTGNNERAHAAVGAMLGNQGRTEEAIAHFKEALRIDPAYGDAHNDTGLALNNLGRFDEAVEHLAIAVRLQPTSASAQHNLGVALAGQRKYGEAIPRYLEALRLDPERAATHRSLGLALMMFGRTDEAIHHYREALRLKPDSAESHNELGFALVAVGLNAEAKTHFHEALRRAPNLAEAHDNLGFVLAGEGRGAEALPHFEEAVRLNPEFARAHLHLGMALGAAGRLDEAAREFREALRINPDDTDAKRLLERTADPASVRRPPRASK